MFRLLWLGVAFCGLVRGVVLVSCFADMGDLWRLLCYLCVFMRLVVYFLFTWCCVLCFVWFFAALLAVWLLIVWCGTVLCVTVWFGLLLVVILALAFGVWLLFIVLVALAGAVGIFVEVGVYGHDLRFDCCAV